MQRHRNKSAPGTNVPNMFASGQCMWPVQGTSERTDIDHDNVFGASKLPKSPLGKSTSDYESKRPTRRCSISSSAGTHSGSSSRTDSLVTKETSLGPIFKVGKLRYKTKRVCNLYYIYRVLISIGFVYSISICIVFTGRLRIFGDMSQQFTGGKERSGVHYEGTQ